jgi:hypothetical protein
MRGFLFNCQNWSWYQRHTGVLVGTPSSKAALRNAHGEEDDYRVIKDAILSRPTSFAYVPFLVYVFSPCEKPYPAQGAPSYGVAGLI